MKNLILGLSLLFNLFAIMWIVGTINYEYGSVATIRAHQRELVARLVTLEDTLVEHDAAMRALLERIPAIWRKEDGSVPDIQEIIEWKYDGTIQSYTNASGEGREV